MATRPIFTVSEEEGTFFKQKDVEFVWLHHKRKSL